MASRVPLSTDRSDRSHLDDIRPGDLLLVSISSRSLYVKNKDTDDISPGDVNPDAGTMNYAIVVMAGVWAFAVGFWFLPKIGGKTFFTYAFLSFQEMRGIQLIILGGHLHTTGMLRRLRSPSVQWRTRGTKRVMVEYFRSRSSLWRLLMISHMVVNLSS